MLLVYQFFKPFKVCDKFFEVALVVYVEAVPQVVAYHHSAESELACESNVVCVHASKGKNLFVDKSLVGCVLKFVHVEAWKLRGALFAKDVSKEYVRRLLLGIFKAVYIVAGAADVTFVA